METLRQQLMNRCKYFNGAHPIETKVCDKGHKYADIVKLEELGMYGCMCRLPCVNLSSSENDNIQHCDDFIAPTDEEIQMEIKLHEEAIECIEKNISPCCKASINESHIIKSGQYKNHGPRFCSECGKLVYMV